MEPVAVLTSGIVFGLTSGFMPGPLTTLIISQTLQHSKLEGMKIALVPLITDGPVVAASTLLVTEFSQMKIIFGTISLTGACFLIYLSYKSFKTGNIEIPIIHEQPRSLQKGIIVNALNPNLYIFWFTVGGAMTMRGLEINIATAVAFLLSFYVCLIAGEMVFILLVNRTRFIFTGRTYRMAMKVLGFLLLIFAVRFVWDFIRFIHVR